MSEFDSLIVTPGPLFTKQLGAFAVSDRLLVPSTTCPATVTMFRPNAGFKSGRLKHRSHEVVHIISGRAVIRILTDGSKAIARLRAGCTYFAPAGLEFEFEALTNCVAMCVYFPTADGTQPDWEELPPGAEMIDLAPEEDVDWDPDADTQD